MCIPYVLRRRILLVVLPISKAFKQRHRRLLTFANKGILKESNLTRLTKVFVRGHVSCTHNVKYSTRLDRNVVLATARKAMDFSLVHAFLCPLLALKTMNYDCCFSSFSHFLFDLAFTYFSQGSFSMSSRVAPRSETPAGLRESYDAAFHEARLDRNENERWTNGFVHAVGNLDLARGSSASSTPPALPAGRPTKPDSISRPSTPLSHSADTSSRAVSPAQSASIQPRVTASAKAPRLQARSVPGSPVYAAIQHPQPSAALTHNALPSTFQSPRQLPSPAFAPSRVQTPIHMPASPINPGLGNRIRSPVLDQPKTQVPLLDSTEQIAWDTWTSIQRLTVRRGHLHEQRELAFNILRLMQLDKNYMPTVQSLANVPPSWRNEIVITIMEVYYPSDYLDTLAFLDLDESFSQLCTELGQHEDSPLPSSVAFHYSIPPGVLTLDWQLLTRKRGMLYIWDYIFQSQAYIDRLRGLDEPGFGRILKETAIIHAHRTGGPPAMYAAVYAAFEAENKRNWKSPMAMYLPTGRSKQRLERLQEIERLAQMKIMPRICELWILCGPVADLHGQRLHVPATASAQAAHYRSHVQDIISLLFPPIETVLSLYIACYIVHSSIILSSPRRPPLLSKQTDFHSFRCCSALGLQSDIQLHQYHVYLCWTGPKGEGRVLQPAGRVFRISTSFAAARHNSATSFQCGLCQPKNDFFPLVAGKRSASYPECLFSSIRT